MLNICSTYVVLNMRLTHEDIFPVYTLSDIESNPEILQNVWFLIAKEFQHIPTDSNNHSSNLPLSSNVSGAHTSILSLPYVFNRQWYCNGLLQVCGYIEQFFCIALWFHSDEFIGQLSMTETESAEGGHGRAMFRTSG